MIDTKNSDTKKPVALLPDQLLSSVVFSKAEGYVLVRGQACKFTRTGDWVFGTLSGVKRSMTFMCPIDRSPSSDDQKVIIGGYLRIIPSKVHNGFDVRIDGEVIGSWARNYNNTDLIILNRTRPVKTSLNKFVQSSKGLNKLLILSTKVGLSEFNAGLKKSSQGSWNECVIRDYDAHKFLEDFNSAINKYRPYAVAIIGGGEESGNTTNIWDDAAVIDKILQTKYIIFSAVGSSDGFALLDKYCDESFSNPAQFGHCVDEAINLSETQNHQTKSLKKLTIDNESLHKKCLEAEDQVSLTSKKHTFLKLQRNILLGVALVCVTILSLKFSGLS